MDEPETWRWIWLGAAVFFGIGEMATPGAFFMAPFAIGAGVAAILAFADAAVAAQWFAFVGVSIVAFAGLRPLARRLDRNVSDASSVGSRRLIGRQGTVLEAIEPGHLGLVRIEREEWRAESPDRVSVPVGASILVTSVEGTRVIVTPTQEQTP
jgi:membrane protein implicated in regulation of membrane protease activity